jgi:quinol monooxygenase YgiN
MLIVAGTFEVDPADRDAFLASRSESIRSARTESGCLEYALSADSVDDTRVLLFERWADQESFDAHVAGFQSGSRPDGPAPRSMSVMIYDIAGERPFG